MLFQILCFKEIAVQFFKDYNGAPFSAIEPDKCSLVFVERIEMVILCAILRILVFSCRLKFIVLNRLKKAMVVACQWNLLRNCLLVLFV